MFWINESTPSSTKFTCSSCGRNVYYNHGSTSVSRNKSGIKKYCPYPFCPWCREANDNKLEYTSPNGYRGVLYGTNSYAIFDRNGKECFHTGFRAINTLGELKQQVDEFPEFLEAILQCAKEDNEH